MAIYLSRKKGGTVATPITPSNSSPAQMTANVAVNPTANGYAIQSYDDIYPGLVAQMIEDGEIYLSHGNMYVIHNQPITIYPSNTNPRFVDDAHIYYEIGYGSGYVIEDYYSVTPSSTPETVSAGNMVQINGSGVIVDSVPTPTSLTPSNSSPATITSGATYTATANGKAVASVTDITPSNSSPVSLSSGSIYKPSASGYAISSYSSKTPSDSSPASVSSGAIIKASASGYLYASSGLKNVPTYFSGISATYNNANGTNSVSVTSGKKYLFIAIRHSTSSTTPGDAGISSGATVDKVYINNVLTYTPRVKLYVALVTATSSTITALGSSNICAVLPLE